MNDNRAIDLRSDTITQPTPAMREAMADAEVGDDVFGEDPTVQRLEARVAGMLGKESALFTPSGTMANQLAVRTHTEPGDEILIDANAHISYYEAGGPAALSGVSCRCLSGVRGVFTATDVETALRPPDQHFPPTKLVCLENTHNRGGGTIWPMERIREVADIARRQGLRMHLDGARLWNASVATGIDERNYAAQFDSVSVCFSKGLGAPVGSALCGSRDFIQRARRFRKMFGGGMRQAGILAAGALYALEHHRSRLAEDHANARALANGLARLSGIELDSATVQTNIVFFSVSTMPAKELVLRLDRAGVRMLATGSNGIRAVTSLMVTADDMLKAVEIVSRAMQSC
ncbi:MAG: aminotransferase class I/II-fold pyridoxal phosphate-dependent enzyme [Planctomycetota bacterium]|nr:aminotransferase class I/II-fold pyridoxal phosphate-dependent enzyme [Planctomycetota bacterium]